MPEAIRRFPNLLGIDVYNSTIAEWRANAVIDASIHQRMLYVALVRINATAFPDGLRQRLPKMLLDIEIAVSNLTELPMDLDVWWPPMTTFYVEHSRLTAFPDALLRLPVDDLSLMGNLIETIDALEDAPLYFTFLALSGNPIRSLPSTVSHDLSIAFLMMDNTLVDAMPSWVADVVQEEATFSGTPFCATMEKNGTPPVEVTGSVTCIPSVYGVSGQPNVVVCAAMASAEDALPTRNYVIDLAVTTERNYNNDELTASWTTHPVNLKAETKPSNRGVFLSTSPASTFIADLVVHRVDTSFENPDPRGAEFLPGGFKLVAYQNLCSATIGRASFLFVREAPFHPPQFSIPTPSSRPPLQASLGTSPAPTLSFKVLQLADLHFTGNKLALCKNPPPGVILCNEMTMSKFVNELLDIEKPDFVVFTGDNVETFVSFLRKPAMDAVTEGVEARKIPYAMVFGNHDDENGFSREEIVQIAVNKPHSYTQRGPRDVPGVGNYELGVQAPVDGPWGPRGTDVFRMYFLDSHGYPDKSRFPHVSTKYDWVKPRQIQFYRQLSMRHAETNNTVPAVMFFHIPIVEYAANAQSRMSGAKNEGVAASERLENKFELGAPFNATSIEANDQLELHAIVLQWHCVHRVRTADSAFRQLH
ncbi:hypothetical protein P43SY_005482 [Pythium insidiosum]|uniref:Calcineurin-like phosphoesterase domain-containing protein n=1 Tax=Pythium insidiosum TaxID=114742 RepID=A0AAD5Q6E6_PYTIN|nr:hypothetical protein P43SY_005482 [Pythium insidiosum]